MIIYLFGINSKEVLQVLKLFQFELTPRRRADSGTSLQMVHKLLSVRLSTRVDSQKSSADSQRSIEEYSMKAVNQSQLLENSSRLSERIEGEFCRLSKQSRLSEVKSRLLDFYRTPKSTSCQEEPTLRNQESTLRDLQKYSFEGCGIEPTFRASGSTLRI